MRLKALIVDDEPLALEVVSVFLQQVPGVEIMGTCENAMEAIHVLNTTPIDVIFLDIQMPALNGLDFIKTLAQKPKIVIISAYRNYAVECYELDVIDYLVKPITFARLLKAVNKVSQMMPASHNHLPETDPERIIENRNDCIFIKADKKIHKVNQDCILYIESLKDYVRVKTSQENLITYCTLSKMTSHLCPDRFLRVHRSYTIAMDKVEMIDGNFAVICGNYIPISRKTKAKMLSKLEQKAR